MNDVIDKRGGNLIFVASQPRAGSTLLQRMLAGHPRIHTTTEPWLMLAPCYALKADGHWADYEAGGWATLARDAFLRDLDGRQTLVRGIREMARSIYAEALAPTGKDFFLDKTPRYYAILPELMEVFPAAHVVILVRNPLAVLCSVVRTWVQTHWERMPSYHDDLLKAPVLLAQGMKLLQPGGRLRVLRYEDLVGDPATHIRALCDALGIPFVPQLLQYGATATPAFAFGDPVGLQQHAEADPGHTERWVEDVRDPTLWRLCAEYLDYLEHTVPGLLGYDGAALRAALAAHRPAGLGTRVGPSLLRTLKGRSGPRGLRWS